MPVNRIAIILGVAAFVFSPAAIAATATFQDDASSEETVKKIDPKEIVYRVNLGRNDDVKLLLTQGVSANFKDDKGVPILSLASMRKDDEGAKIMKTLVDAGADINAKDNNGQSALFYASKKGNEDAVKFLLENKINYYAVDANGDIARTIAYRAGYSEIVKIMDNFVKAETAKITEQYRELSKALEERYKAQDVAVQEAEKKAADEAAKAALERNRLLAEQQNAEAASAAELEAKRASDAFVQTRYDLAFHACAFQYWSFCKDMKQTSELSEEMRDNAIDSHAQKVEELNKEMMGTYQIPAKQTGSIIQLAQQSIFNQLMSMPSKTYRFEHGVCKMQDMVKRCDYVAKYPGHLTHTLVVPKSTAAPPQPLPENTTTIRRAQPRR